MIEFVRLETEYEEQKELARKYKPRLFPEVMLMSSGLFTKRAKIKACTESYEQISKAYWAYKKKVIEENKLV